MFFFYLVRIIFLISTNSIFSFWLFMELNTVRFLVLLIFYNFHLKSKEKRELINQCFYYFILQSCVSIMILIVLTLRNFFLIELKLLVRICLIFKLGLFPFYFWVLKLLKYIDWFGTFMLLGPQKLYLIILAFIDLNLFLNFLF